MRTDMTEKFLDAKELDDLPFGSLVDCQIDGQPTWAMKIQRLSHLSDISDSLTATTRPQEGPRVLRGPDSWVTCFPPRDKYIYQSHELEYAKLIFNPAMGNSTTLSFKVEPEQALNDPTVQCCGRDAADCDCLKNEVFEPTVFMIDPFRESALNAAVRRFQGGMSSVTPTTIVNLARELETYLREG